MLTAEQRDRIRIARDAAIRSRWDAHGRNVAEFDHLLLGALDSREWQTAEQISEAVGLGSRQGTLSAVGRQLAARPEVEVRRRPGRQATYRRKLPPAG